MQKTVCHVHALSLRLAPCPCAPILRLAHNPKSRSARDSRKARAYEAVYVAGGCYLLHCEHLVPSLRTCPQPAECLAAVAAGPSQRLCTHLRPPPPGYHCLPAGSCAPCWGCLTSASSWLPAHVSSPRRAPVPRDEDPSDMLPTPAQVIRWYN